MITKMDQGKKNITLVLNAETIDIKLIASVNANADVDTQKPTEENLKE